MSSSVISSPNLVPPIPGYIITEQLYVGSRTVVYRALQMADQRSVVIKILRREYPSFSELVQFRNQYSIAKQLPIAGIVRPFSLERIDSRYALVMEDVGGVALGTYLQQQPLSVADILAIALQLADILHALGQRHVVHKDIKPANILIHPVSKQIKLIDFSIASLLPKETQEIQSPSQLEGTLAYLAPEQTGRMNRGIDYRTDFYSLGVTLYHLLTGGLPFTAEDPLELMHCHIAKTPVPIDQVNPIVPKMVAQIVSKLMAKNAEERYQSAIGLKQDLDQCLTQWTATGRISEFRLGQHDLSDRFLIPETLYGREAEVQTLLSAFERIAVPSAESPNGRSELILVAGFSGVGKTAVINEVHKPIVRQRGYFIKGKFDQFNRNIPFSAFVQALRDLMAQLLSESDRQLQTWKEKFLAALGDSAQVIIDVIPELERILGAQSPAAELVGTAAQNRFNLLFQNFIQVFTTPEHPLVIFLDDLQWVDSASLALMRLLMSDTRLGYLLLIGAYRDNEVFPGHPLMLTLEEIGTAGTTISTITLSPLSQASLNQLVADTLACSIALAQPLTELVHQKTQGNPFFATQFLKALHQDGLMRFDPQAGYWQCEIGQVRSAALTDDVANWMMRRLQKFPVATQTILKFAACIGNQFDLNTLAIAASQPEATVAEALWPALQEGLIHPQTDVYKFFDTTLLTAGQSDWNAMPGLDAIRWEQESLAKSVTYRFLHDRIQQAAYNLMADEQRSATHWMIGQLLHANTAPADLDAHLFEIVSHLNRGIEHLTEPAHSRNLIHLNQLAGRKAKAAIAYTAAVNYFNQSIQLLPPNAWATDYKLTLTLHQERLEAACLNQDFDQLPAWESLILEAATHLLDTIEVYETRMTAYRSQGHYHQVVETGLQVLRQLGIEFPAQPTPADIGAAAARTHQLWCQQSPLALLDLPTMSDRHWLAAMQLLTKLVPSAYIGAPALLPLFIFKQVELSIQYGNSPISVFSYADYGLVLCGVMGDLDAGYAFGQLSSQLLDKLQATALKGRGYFIINSYIRHWKEPLSQTLPGLLAAYQSSLDAGDWECVALNLFTYSQYSYWSGGELEELAADMEQYRQVIATTKQATTLKYHECYQQVILNLLGQSPTPDQLEGNVFSAADALSYFQASTDRTGLFYTRLQQAILSYWFGQSEVALQQILFAAHYQDAAAGSFTGVIYYFYDALIHLAHYPAESAEQQDAILARVDQHLSRLDHWANHAACNHQHRWHLITAERCRVLGQLVPAIEHYDRAIELAQTSGYLNDQALANELAAQFYLSWGKEKIATVYLQEAYQSYARWGAKAKTDDLETRYPHQLASTLTTVVPLFNPLETLAAIAHSPVDGATTGRSHPSSSQTSLHSSLDFTAILRASQNLSGAIYLDDLLHQLTQIILQSSGADRCVLILPNQTGEWQVRAMATPDKTQLCAEPFIDHPQVPTKLIQYVKNSQNVVVVDDLKTDLPVIGEYLTQHKPKSVLGVPILNQGHLIGILYLSNQTTVGVFTSDRVLMLNFLCTQAAISLENARLYQQSQMALAELQQSQQLLRNIIDTIPQVVFWKDRNSTYLGCNQKFATMAGLSSPEEIVGKTDYDLPWSKAESDAYREYDRQIMTSRQAELHIIETQQQTDGSTLWVDTNKIPLCDETGNVYGILGSYEDISDRKRAEAAVLQKSQELEQALADLQQAQLQIVQGEKMASLGNLVAGVAHEINNPIGFLNGSINNAQDYVTDLLGHLALYHQHYPDPVAPIQESQEEIDLEFVSADLPKLLESMKGATDRIKSISTSLRTFSRADTEHKVSAQLHEGIDSTILILKYRLKANEFRPAIQVIQDYRDLPSINCFPGQLNQVFMNILANAIDMFDDMAQSMSLADLKANPQQITIQTALIPEQKAVEIRIRDNGKGMTEEVQARIFDHLFTTKGVGKGTGLGLAIARQIIVETHGGQLEVQSAEGQGAEFRIQLPIA